MAQGGLHQVNRGASVKGMGSVAMAKPMWGNLALHPGTGGGGFDNAPCLGRVQVAPPFRLTNTG